MVDISLVLNLYYIEIQLDWGWAEDYVAAMYLMLQQEESDEYAIATGESYQLAELIEIAFRLVGLDWREYVVIDKGLCLPTDLVVSRGNPSKARERLGWVAKHKIADIVRLTILSRGEATPTRVSRIGEFSVLPTYGMNRATVPIWLWSINILWWM